MDLHFQIIYAERLLQPPIYLQNSGHEGIDSLRPSNRAEYRGIREHWSAKPPPDGFTLSVARYSQRLDFSGSIRTSSARSMTPSGNAPNWERKSSIL